MRCIRIDLSSWTASFRYPNLISGVQPTLEVPPLSTILGLMNAAAGQYLVHDKDLLIGYYFEFASKVWDTETIYQRESGSKGEPTNTAKSNVMQREFLFEAKLSLYLQDSTLVSYFQEPAYPLLLGRSGDLASVDSVKEIELTEVENSNIKGQIVPFNKHHLPGKIQALPVYFTNSIPRRNLGTMPFSIIRFDALVQTNGLKAYRDPNQGKNSVDIYMHLLNSESLK